MSSPKGKGGDVNVQFYGSFTGSSTWVATLLRIVKSVFFISFQYNLERAEVQNVKPSVVYIYVHTLICVQNNASPARARDRVLGYGYTNRYRLSLQPVALREVMKLRICFLNFSKAVASKLEVSKKDKMKMFFI